MKTVEFFRQLLRFGSIEKVTNRYPSITQGEIYSHFQCVFDRCNNEGISDSVYELYTDGAAKGNPGSAGIGFVIKKDGFTIEEQSKHIGNTTNNVAEYTALIEGLQRLKELGVSNIRVFSDSELMVKQIKGDYSVKSNNLKKLYDKVCLLVDSFDTFSIKHIPRNLNKEADRLSKLGADS